jgi:hypothetical protein
MQDQSLPEEIIENIILHLPDEKEILRTAIHLRSDYLKRKVIPQVSDASMDSASAKGQIDLLNWWKDSGLDVIYTNDSMNEASKNGHLSILDWWKNSGFTLKYTPSAIHNAVKNGQSKVLEWWNKSGLMINLDDFSNELAEKTPEIDLNSTPYNDWMMNDLLKSTLDIQEKKRAFEIISMKRVATYDIIHDLEEDFFFEQGMELVNEYLQNHPEVALKRGTIINFINPNYSSYRDATLFSCFDGQNAIQMGQYGDYYAPPPEFLAIEEFPLCYFQNVGYHSERIYANLAKYEMKYHWSIRSSGDSTYLVYTFQVSDIDFVLVAHTLEFLLEEDPVFIQFKSKVEDRIKSLNPIQCIVANNSYDPFSCDEIRIYEIMNYINTRDLTSTENNTLFISFASPSQLEY